MLKVGQKVKRQGAVNVVATDDEGDGVVVEWVPRSPRDSEPNDRVTVRLNDGSVVNLHDVEEQLKKKGRSFNFGP
jgi:hypothetical protein